MVKLSIVVNVKAGMEPADALEYWVGTHGPIVTKVPGLRSYVQHHATEGLGGPAPFLGYAEMTFDDRASADTALATPEFAAALADAGNFIDLPSLMGAWVEDHAIV